MPLIHQAVVGECDSCGHVDYTPATENTMNFESRLPTEWVKVEHHYGEGRTVFAFCSWSCLADYADEQDPTAQAMLVEGT